MQSKKIKSSRVQALSVRITIPVRERHLGHLGRVLTSMVII